ncbi:hypothetical protein D8B46_07575 [Candidatus Gracilibacteria bacterium]|nr:MAG: hypothetical protein D8B46_07575 [Candidatus Gracilibacteria bacterium]
MIKYIKLFFKLYKMTNFETINVGNQQLKVEGPLTDQERSKLEKFLKSKQEPERQVVIEISQNEIEKLRNVLNDDSKLSEFLGENEIPKNTVNGSAELLSGSKLEENFGNKENFINFTKTFDSQIENYFFGQTGILKGLKISENEKKNFTAGASVYFMDSIYKEIEKSGNFAEIKEEIQKALGSESEKGNILTILEKLGNETENISETVKNLKDLFSGNTVEILKKAYNPQKAQILTESFSGVELKNNQIFSNPNSTFELFEKIEQNASKKDLKDFINSKNSENPVNTEQDFSEFKEVGDKIGNIITPEIGNGLGKIQEITEKFSEIKNGIKNKILGNPELAGTLATLSSIPLVGEFISMILGFFGIDINELKNNSSLKLEKVKENISKKGSFLEQAKFLENFGKQENGEIDENFLTSIEYISGNNDESKLQESLEKLFKKGGDFENFIKSEELNKLQETQDKKELVNNNGEINYKNLNFYINLYKEFLQQKSSNSVNGISDFVNQKIKPNENTVEKQEEVKTEESKDEKNPETTGKDETKKDGDTEQKDKTETKETKKTS